MLVTATAPAAHALTPLSTLRICPDITVNFSGTTVTPQNVAQDNLAGTVSLVNIGAIPLGTDVTAYHLLANGDQLLAFDTTVSLAGGVTARPGDAVRFNGATYTLEFDATANGVPNGLNTDAVGVTGGSDLLLSFDTTVTLGAVTADKEDLVRFDGIAFTMFFDASAAGVPPGVDLDALDYLDSNGHLLLSFDTSGSAGGVAFDKEDILEFTPGANTWQMAYDGSAQHAEWPPANLVALGGVALGPPPPPPPPPDSDGDGSADPSDNCPTVSNPDQQETDGDGVGDACDNCPNDFNPAQSDGNHNGIGDLCDTNPPASFALKRVRLRADTATVLNRDNGAILVRAFLDPADFGGNLQAVLSGGFVIGVSGAGLVSPERMIFQYPHCVTFTATRFVCIGNQGEMANLRRRRKDGLFRVRITAAQRSFPPPLSKAGVEVVLSAGGLDRRDQITSCRLLADRVVGCRK